ncbi:MAG: ComEC/Rec2 family competence protein [Muribaculaceae bacterium]
MNRRHFISSIALAGASLAGSALPLKAAETVREKAKRLFKSPSGFTLWQLPSQHNDIGNSYVLLTDKGRVVVMDGGTYQEADYLRGFIEALGNEVEAWIISHPHPDHMGALNEILKRQWTMKINRVYHSRVSDAFFDCEPDYSARGREYYATLDKSGIPVTDYTEAGDMLQIDGLNMKILGVKNEDIGNYNDSSLIIRAWDKHKSVLFLGDAGAEQGNRLLAGPYASDLDCDYIQMSHHGQRGCSEEFYKTVKFHACLWPTPLWVWNNDGGQGINTAHLKTFDTRRWMDEKGIKEHHVSCLEGIWRLD